MSPNARVRCHSADSDAQDSATDRHPMPPAHTVHHKHTVIISKAKKHIVTHIDVQPQVVSFADIGDVGNRVPGAVHCGTSCGTHKEWMQI